MINTKQIILIFFISMAFVGCGNHKSDSQIIEVKDSVKKAPVTQRMQEYKSTSSITWRGSTYTYCIHRMVDQGLPVVTDDNGTKFFDNKIDLTITHDGTQFFSQTFTKSTFSPYIDEAFKKKGILEGLVFDKVGNGYLQFAASVCFPQTDEYIPLIIKLSADGSVSIARDTKMDSGNDTNAEDEE